MALRTPAPWLLFLALALAWGSSYAWIKVALGTVPPVTLVAARLVLGAVLLGTIVAATRSALPRDVRTWLHLLVLAIVNIVVPFTLIAVAEQSIDSALASILNATVPLTVILVAPLVLPDERITLARVAGLAVGFGGVVVLLAPDLAGLGDADLTGELMLLGSSVSYGIGNVYARRNVGGLAPAVPAFLQVGLAAAIMAPAALATELLRAPVAPGPEAIAAIAWLGLVGSGVAYLCYFALLAAWGATRTSMVAYALPVAGIAIGALVLRDPVTPGRLAGTGLVIAGIALVNSSAALRRIRAARRDAEGAAGR